MILNITEMDYGLHACSVSNMVKYVYLIKVNPISTRILAPPGSVMTVGVWYSSVDTPRNNEPSLHYAIKILSI